jgi:perosamine synthetase
MHEQPVFQQLGLLRDARCPNAERLGRRGFYLPSGLALTDAQIDQVCAAMAKLMRLGA